MKPINMWQVAPKVLEEYILSWTYSTRMVLFFFSFVQAAAMKCSFAMNFKYFQRSRAILLLNGRKENDISLIVTSKFIYLVLLFIKCVDIVFVY